MKTALVQAADVVANFGLATLRNALDPNPGEGTRIKARVFEEAFDTERLIRSTDPKRITFAQRRFACHGPIIASHNIRGVPLDARDTSVPPVSRRG